MSPQLKLSLTLSTIFAAIVAVLGLAVNIAVAQTARTALESALIKKALALVAAHPQTSISLTVADESRDPEHGQPVNPFLTSVQFVNTTCAPGGITQCLRASIARSEALPVSDAGFAALRLGKSWTELRPIETEPVLIYSQPIMTNNHVIGVAQVGKPYGPQLQLLSALHYVLLIAGSLATVAVFGLTWAVSGQQLGPLFKTLRLVTTRAEQAERRVNDQREFVADVSHELRAPLTTVRGNLGLLKRATLTDDDRQAVMHDAIDEVERMSRMVNELLLLSRSGDQRVLCTEPIVLTDLAQSICRKVTTLARGRMLVSDLEPNIKVCGDVDAINQVILILLDNAIKYTSLGGKITLGLRRDATYARLSVADTGVGIAPDALPHVFDRFYRARPADDVASALSSLRMTSRNGHGLGLAIAKSLVEAHGGSIDVASFVGQGTTFTVLLPLSAGRLAG